MGLTMRQMAIGLVAMFAFAASDGSAASAARAGAAPAVPPDYAEKIRCLAAFEAAAATLAPDPGVPAGQAADGRGNGAEANSGREAALRERLDRAGEALGRAVDSRQGLTARDREEGDRIYDQESNRLFMMLENARGDREMERAFQTLKAQVDRCFALAGQ